MDIVEISLDEIREAEFNYNLHPQNQIDELCKSLEEFGQFKNIVLWKGFCIAGNGLVFAAREMGLETLRAIVRDDLTEEQARRLCITDNATPYLARPDSYKLNELLASLPSVDDIPGVDKDWLDSVGVNVEDINEVEYDFSEFDEDNESMEGMEKKELKINIPTKYYEKFVEWAANGEMKTSYGIGKGLIKRCGLL